MQAIAQHPRSSPDFDSPGEISTALSRARGMPTVIASRALKDIVRQIHRIAATTVTVLISGESGSGKEVIARAVHEFSPRGTQAWIDVNCAALPAHLVESELFGYEKGAFSGADSAKPGMFALANHGTLSLDEIGELDVSGQSKLLRVLDGRPHYSLGGTRKIEVDVRILAATNSNLEAAVHAGKFRADLFHRLNQMRVAVPPLRERIADIGPLAELFLSGQRAGCSLSAGALSILQRYPWPGNVRELRSAMVRSAVFAAERAEISAADLPQEILPKLKPASAPESYSLDRLEKQVIFNPLVEYSGRHNRAGAMLGISRRTLSRRLKRYGEYFEQFAASDGLAN